MQAIFSVTDMTDIRTGQAFIQMMSKTLLLQLRNLLHAVSDCYITYVSLEKTLVTAFPRKCNWVHPYSFQLWHGTSSWALIQRLHPGLLAGDFLTFWLQMALKLQTQPSNWSSLCQYLLTGRSGHSSKLILNTTICFWGWTAGQRKMLQMTQ